VIFEAREVAVLDFRSWSIIFRVVFLAGPTCQPHASLSPRPRARVSVPPSASPAPPPTPVGRSRGGARRRPLAGLAWTARPLTSPAPRPFASSPSPFKRAIPLPGQTLARSLPSARRPPQSATVGGPPPDCPRVPRPLVLLTRSRPSATSLPDRSRSPTRTSISRRHSLSRRRSPPRPACPCRGRAPLPCCAARARALSALFRLGPCRPRRRRDIVPRAHAHSRTGHIAGAHWLRPVASQGPLLALTPPGRGWQPGPACRRPGALDPGGSSGCSAFSFI
jgi:hypothetical protein